MSPLESVGKRFRDSYAYIRQVGESAPRFENPLGQVAGGMEMLPRPTGARLPLLITGASQQSAEWVASQGDGWMTYPRPEQLQSQMIDDFNTKVKQAGEPPKPVMEPLYIDLVDDANATAKPIHLGLRLGVNALRHYLTSREAIGVNHIALNLRFNSRDVEQTIRTIAAEILPIFNQQGEDK